MADLRLSEMDTIGGSSVADADLFAVLDVSDTGGTSGSASGTDKSITEVELLKMIRRHFDVVQVIASSGATLSVDLTNGRVADVTLDANCAITFTNPTAATPRSTPVTLILRQDSGGRNTS